MLSKQNTKTRKKKRSTQKSVRNKFKSTVPAGFCICNNCGKISIHREGVLCNSLKCPKCGERMLKDLPWKAQL